MGFRLVRGHSKNAKRMLTRKFLSIEIDFKEKDALDLIHRLSHTKHVSRRDRLRLYTEMRRLAHGFRRSRIMQELLQAEAEASNSSK